MAIKRNLVGNFLGQAWSAAIGLAFVPLWVSHLGLEAYGLIGFFAILQGSLALLDFGMTPTMTREMARATAGAHTPESISDLLRSIEILCFAVASVTGVLVWLSSNWLAQEWFSPQTLTRPAIANAISVMAVVIGLRFCEGIYRGALFGMERQFWYNGVNAVLVTMRNAGAAVVVIWISASVEAFFAWQALTSALAVGVLAVATRRWMPRAGRRAHFSAKALKAVAAFAGGLSATTLLGLLLTHLDKLMLSRLLPLDVFGHYMLAVAIVGIFSMLVWPISAAYYPSLTVAATTRNDADVERHYCEAAQLSALLIAPAVAICVCFPNSLMFAWTGDPTLAAEVGPLLRLLSIGMACNSLLQVPFALQLAHGWTSLSVKVNSIAVLLLLPGEYVALLHFGTIGVAAVWSTANAAIMILVVFLTHRRLVPAARGRWFLHTIVSALASLAVAGASAWAVPDPASRLGKVGLILATGSVAFAVAGLSLPAVRRMLFRAGRGFPRLLPATRSKRSSAAEGPAP